MPTLPPGVPPPPPQGPRQVRNLAESFGTDPARYDRARPRYPDAMVAAVAARIPGPEVVDVGIGTGIAARQFRAAGCTVLGVEADPRMAEWTRHRGIDVEVAAFEAWDPAGRTFDAVVSGQTWHWVDPVAGAAKAAEALRPGGRLAVFWNADRPPQDVARAFAEVYGRLLPGSPAHRRWASAGTVDGYAMLCAKAAGGIRSTGAYGDPEQWSFSWERTYGREEWLDQLPTTGGHSGLPSADLAKLLDGIGEVVDAAGGSFTMPYDTLVVTAATLPGSP
ncbi:class I SAM-dependent methyltransferase [Kitasatospora sp. KL5]|uniref:class I SAM-dependent methyltransferase n=1 Tax=Kitasatospora sp. KL5 TaxID=3425125 RepID=UPI003D6DE4C7